ncbi:hypothetical protein RhiirA5_420758 [Rhizophagus irregularis]|uniref:Uncharacterized protein n=1 Tax=Rhizophagus irregularis TaxID=588596 RepID=A0A2I1ECF4_9GLOM|nr:hypothetical protein RhiirA5_420758 [Rhizophagus irregularis]PKY19777.1 hypothetical protein RhiirB3_432921 [Rhizophagus irregularis]CAB4397923.1 unnamed protein product [Rhizophagus irregularis]CAB5348749.1 unnamed protein product [Rhizophagus irregularis]CAB5380911.1 unnamed protein product [Rhizophagus irregularis]
MSYSLEAIFYITLQSISILLLLYLVFNILKSKSSFTKWTLFQLCISALGDELTNLPPIIIYGDNLLERANETPLCIILQKISSYFLYPLEFFSLTLTFYLWHALITQKLDIEKKCFVYISGMIWVYTTIYNGILLRNIGKDDILVSHSTLMLWRYWINFSNYSNRRNAIKLGEAARLCVWCYISVILLLLLLIPRAIYHDPTNVLIVEICNFGSALVGTLLFLVFGTQKKAAVFLPCCYYVPPGTPQFLPDETTDGNNNNSNELTQMPIAHIRQK